MNEVTGTITAEAVVLSLSGRIDSGNASRVQEMIQKLLPARLDRPVVLDMKELEYISSAGLRVLLHLKKACPALRLINVGSEAYEILDMTGFTQMMEVEKAYREVSIEGCQAIGRGANGTLYRIAPDTVVKVYNHPDALADIRHEREVAKLALILGIPTAISYDLVRVGERYGSVFELLRARSLSDILATTAPWSRRASCPTCGRRSWTGPAFCRTTCPRRRGRSCWRWWRPCPMTTTCCTGTITRRT